MTAALIDDLAQAAGDLRIAMKAADLALIETSVARLHRAVEAVQAVGAWRADPALKARISTLMDELASSRMLAALLGDLAGQMHAAAAARAIDAPQPVYGRRG